ncbi:MAG TPA: D-glycerate dehydrogenase [Solirubrobacterales bacterium]|nr:D-glycerate dehydrogenase [Solirubrobacterales bacterium]
MNGERQVVVVARVLLPAGRDRLAERFELREGGHEVTRADLLELAPGAGAIVADPSVPVDAELLDAAGPQLEVVANFAVGYDNVDLEACRERGIAVTNTPDVLTEATAELAMALTLAAARRMSDAERDLRAGHWRGWDPAAYRGIEIGGSTVGVVGMGRIGHRYARLTHGLGAQIVYAGPTPKPQAEQELGARRLEFEELLAAADVVSLHAPSTPDTQGLIGARELELIGPQGVLVNTSRGPLVDSEAVAAALEAGTLGAAGLDVYKNEPEVSPRLLKAPRCVLLPHIGSATVTARDAMANAVADNVIAVLEGREPPSRVA